MALESIQFTGERMVPGKAFDIFFWEHFERYQFAHSLASQKYVLDIGSGHGYGVNHIADVARLVVGADKEWAALAGANSCCLRKNQLFVQADACNLGFSDESFDIVTAFEIIEHIADPHGMLKEINRVLKPGGKLIVSTPNKALHSPSRGRPRSPYHIKEFYYHEFLAMLKEYFSDIIIYYQPTNGLISKLYVIISRHLDLQVLGGWLLGLQRFMLSSVNRLFRIQDAERSDIAIAKAKKRASSISVSGDKKACLSFVAVCVKNIT